MALYQQHRVNPMSGCLPMLLQIPIFLGLYNAILGLSNQGEGVWHNAFLWIPNLSQPDPIRLLPFLAGGFQFVQTKMMRPYKQGKITDPQQAMMNTMMNFMPLTVIIFGWGFASGPVLYWATQSVYSVIQQWFITGWGSMRDWFGWLPEMPEHRRLGYRPPRSLDDVVVVSGDEDGAPVRPAGMMGWFQRRMEEAQKQAAARREGTGATGSDVQARADAESQAIAASARTGAGTAGARNSNRRNRGGQRARGTAATKSGAGAGNGTVARANDQPERADGASRAVVVPRKARPTPNDGKNRG